MVKPEVFKARAWTLKLLALCATSALVLQSAAADDINGSNVIVGSSIFSATSNNCQAASNLALALGINITEDPLCSTSVYGCYSLHCRFCQTYPTARSTGYLPCPPAPTPAPTTAAPTPAPTTSAPGPTTTAPGPTSAPPAPTTAAPTTAAPTEQPIGTQLEIVTCDAVVTPGDKAAGVNIVADAHCANGGLGCFQDTCRYCKVRDTPQSAHWLSCQDLALLETSDTLSTIPVPTGACPAVTPGDANAGVNVVTDATCVSGGIGCFQDSCRFCKNWDSTKSSAFLSCSSFGLVPTSAPATSTPTTLAPTTGICTVTPGDASVGISSFTDFACGGSQPGVGCYTTTCRYCKTKDTDQSKHLVACPAQTPAPTAPVPTTPAPTTAAPTEAPIGGSLSVSECPFQVSAGDKAAGLSVITDLSCASGGLGCFQNICRFCRTKPSTKPSDYLSCSDLLAGVTSAPTPAITSAPVSLSPAAAATSAICAQSVSVGDKGVGISAYCDESCKTRAGIGCFFDTCRLCKTQVTPQSKHLVDCPVIPTATTPAPTTPAPTTPAPEGPLGGTLSVDDAACPTVSAGDALNGINIVCDTRCLTKSIVGCIPTRACRYCAKTVTAKSKHLETCAGSTTAAPKLLGLLVKLADASASDSLDKASSSSASLSPLEYAVGGAAAIGVAVIVAVLVVGVKRAVMQLRAISSVQVDEVAA